MNFSGQNFPVPLAQDELKQRLDYQWSKLNKEQKRHLIVFLDSMLQQ